MLVTCLSTMTVHRSLGNAMNGRVSIGTARRGLQIRMNLPLAVPVRNADVHQAHFRDPDANWVELYWDWPVQQRLRGRNWELAMHARGLDVEGLLAEGRSYADGARST